MYYRIMIELEYAYDVDWFYEDNGDTNKNKVIIG